ncbi:MAG TPA: sensor histidine kinase [Lactobacillus sp.]|nr:sensor histidine kinase [Lactobacillus sp.]
MKKFIEKNILFPKRFGLMPYFWVFSLLLIISQILVTHKPFSWLDLVFALVYLKFYHDGYSIHRLVGLDIGIQFLIATYFTIKYPDGGGSLFIYTAWEIGSLPFKNKQFYQALIAYLIVSLSCVSYFIVTGPNKPYDIFATLFSLAFVIGSPFAARSVSNSYHRSYQARLNNRRFETIIKQNERDRIAKDLHDNLGQSFSMITLKSELANKLIDKDPQKAHQQLKDIAETSRSDLNLVRQIVADLNEKSIAGAMIDEEKNLSLAKIRQISINEDISNDWSKDIQHVLAAVIKEATTNVIRYSQANLMKFDFKEDSQNYLLEIQDDGIGLKSTKDHVSFGMVGMSTRLQDIDGKITVISNRGVTLKILIPKKA